MPDFTFVALSTNPNSDETGQHAAPGAFIELQIVSVEGPAGGQFGFWESEWVFFHTPPTVSFLSGTTNGTFRFDLSDYRLNNGIKTPPGGDPYGHIHDRAFTVTKLGKYRIGFQLFDTSANGAGGGPFHTPSDVLYIDFEAKAGPRLTATRSGTNISLSWQSRADWFYDIEWSNDLVTWTWLTGSDPADALLGTGGTMTFPTGIGGNPKRFYRLTEE